jgi:hypothetical protein
MITYISTSFSPDLLNPLCSINKKSDLVYAQCCVLCAMDVRQIEPFHLTELITRPLRQLCKPNRLCHKRLQTWQPTNFYPPSLLWKNKNGSFAFMQAWISEMRGLNIKQPINVGPVYCLCSSLPQPIDQQSRSSSDDRTVDTDKGRLHRAVPSSNWREP